MIIPLQVDEQLIRKIEEQVTKVTEEALTVKVNGECIVAATINFSLLLYTHSTLSYAIDKLAT